jgi:N6-adenosine-specific RNA methylase IME4
MKRPSRKTRRAKGEPKQKRRAAKALDLRRVRPMDTPLLLDAINKTGSQPRASAWKPGAQPLGEIKQQSLPVRTIKIGRRFRKDLGDVAALARSIDQNGLLHPIVVDREHHLIAGQRRLEAWKKSIFAKEPIPVHIVPLQDILTGEWAENDPALRRDFRPTEFVEIMRALERTLKPAAAARKAHGKTAPGRDADQSIGEGRVRDRAASFVGKTRKTLEKAAQVADAAKENPKRFGKLAEDMDRTGRVNGPFKRLERMRQGDEIRKAMPPLPMQGPYGGLVIDFPWPNEPGMSQEDIDARGRSLRPYPAMSISAGCRFLKDKVKPLLDKNAVIGMWATNYHMPYAFELLEALGVPIGKHSTIVTWVKDKMGRGQVRRDKTEHCIIALIGKPVVTLTNETTVLEAPWSGNSHKPNRFYEEFERTFPARRYAEIFSMGGRGDNWDCHGNQVGKFAPAVARSAEAALLAEAAKSRKPIKARSESRKAAA